MSFDPASMIEHNRLALLRLLSGLFLQVGTVPGGAAIDVLPRYLRAVILSVLRRAESAARRLVAARARGIAVPDYAPRSGGQDKKSRSREASKAKRAAGFPLFDSLPNPDADWKRRPKVAPRILSFDEPFTPQIIPPEPDPQPEDLIDSASLCGRLQALQTVLEDLDSPARRFARELARRGHPLSRRKKRVTGLRPSPPGYRRRWSHLIDEILWDGAALERRVQHGADTS